MNNFLINKKKVKSGKERQKMNHRHRIFEKLAGQLEYGDFYDIAAYGNENWKGSYTPKEVVVLQIRCTISMQIRCT